MVAGEGGVAWEVAWEVVGESGRWNLGTSTGEVEEMYPSRRDDGDLAAADGKYVPW